MGAIFKVDLKRAFLSRGFLIAIWGGCILCVWQFAERIPSMLFIMKQVVSGNSGYDSPDVLYGSWLGAACGDVQNNYFFLILPLLAVLPIGSNLYQDIQTDYLKQLELRVKRKQVLFAKWLAAFVSGAVTVTLPLLLSLLLYMSFLPVTKMYSGGTAALMLGISDTDAIANVLLPEHPMIYTLFSLCLIFMISGLFAASSLIMAYVSEYRAVALTLPFVLNLAILTVFKSVGWYEKSFTAYIQPGGTGAIGLVTTVMTILFLLITLLPVFFRLGDD